MKNIMMTMMTLLIVWPAAAGGMMHGRMPAHGMMGMAMPPMGGDEQGDARISLGLSPAMRLMQKRMMREHLAAVSEIVALMAEGKLATASGIAHNRLGLTPKMKKMCDMFGNADFRAMGLAFHKRADRLGDVLKTGNLHRSLRALHAVVNSCVQCHAAFRQ